MTVVPGTLSGNPASSARHPRDVAVVLAGLIGRAPKDVVDPLGIDLRARDERADRERGQVVGTHRRKRAAPAPDRRPQRVDDDDFTQFSHTSLQPQNALGVAVEDLSMTSSL